jgi:hypothetical protein
MYAYARRPSKVALPVAGDRQLFGEFELSLVLLLTKTRPLFPHLSHYRDVFSPVGVSFIAVVCEY